eukprot:GFUD01106904.1.p1 GENE.GFUD01106904.1~~GFUD01106904.1.p1  ORF type:complete len:285 (+),score=83.32 GFUD01106904.1:51-905(+)
MLSLRNLCLLKVSSLKVSYGADEIPSTLAAELKKMLLFNGNFFGQEEYVGNPFSVIEHQALKEHVLTIQYQGEDTWAFGICNKCSTCSHRTCYGGLCGKKPERMQFVLKEGKTSGSDAVFALSRGLSRYADEEIHDVRGQPVSAVLSVENGNVPDSGQLVFSSSAVVLETGEEIICKFLVNSNIGSSPVFKRSFTWGGTWEIPLILTECQVTAKDAFPEPVTKCEYIDEDLNDTEEETDDDSGEEEESDDGNLTDSEEESDDGDLTDSEEEEEESGDGDQGSSD